MSSSMKPYPSVLHAHANNMRPVIGFAEPKRLDEASDRDIYIYIYIYT